MRFTKMHGIGNDYVYVNGFAEKLDASDLPALAQQISDRHFGVGGDGLIAVLPPEQGVDAHVRMRMFNADGSESEMCGNGIRCVCKLAHDHGVTAANPMRIQTGRGVLTLRYTTNGGGKVDQITVDMGEPILEAGKIPVELPGVKPTDRVVNYDLERNVYVPAEVSAEWIDHCGFEKKMTCVSMGNPHAVMYCQDTVRLPLEHIGPLLEQHPMFPRRCNVHFVRVHSPTEVTMRTWERGSGITLACGTGAAAVCVAGVLTGRSSRKIVAHLPGGDLTLDFKKDDGRVYMTGPATEVFSGEWEPSPAAVSIKSHV